MSRYVSGVRTWRTGVQGVSAQTAGGAVMLVMGLALTGFAVVWLAVTVGIGLLSGAGEVLLDDTLVEVDGYVVDLEESRTSDGDRSCRAVVAFTGTDGEPRTVTSRVSESPCRQLGDAVRVHVDPADASRAYLDPFTGPAGLLLPIFAVVGGVVLVAGLALLVRGGISVRRGRRAATLAPAGGAPPTPGTAPYQDAQHPGPAPAARPSPYAVPDDVAYGRATTVPGTPYPHVDEAPEPPRPEDPPAAGTSGASVAPPLF